MDTARLEPEGDGVGEGAGGEYDPQAIDEPSSSTESVIRKFISRPLFIEAFKANSVPRVRCLVAGYL